MIQYSKLADERRDAGTMECWCLHGAVGMAADWRNFAKAMVGRGIGSRAVDLWRFLECEPMPLVDFGKAIHADAGGEVFRGNRRALLGYSMGGRLALHALLEAEHPWQAAVIVSAHPGLECEAESRARRARDAEWASQVLTGDWQEFLEAWNSQAVLGTSPMRDALASGSLIARRRELARSFVDWSLGAQRPLWSRLPEITVPVLWVVGEHDFKFLEIATRAVDLMPNAVLAVAPSSGHRVPWEAEGWFSERVAEFLLAAK